MARVLSLNIEHSKHLGRLIPFLSEYKPDVVCLQELVASDIEAIQEQTGLAYSHFVPMAQHPLDGPGQPFGVGILARQPFEEADFITYAGVGDGTAVLDRSSAESRLATCRYVVALARQALPDVDLRIATTHFPWTPDGQPRVFQADAVVRLIEKLGDDPIILTGDFNAPRGGPIFRKLAAAWKDCIPANVTTSLDPELHRAGPLELLVDGLFATNHYAMSQVRLHAHLSDHQGITACVERKV